MADQDTGFDTAAIEREALVRTTIVERKNSPAVIDDEDRTVAAVNDKPALRLQLFEGSRKREFLGRRVHCILSES
jgi:hypothetical protein